MRILVTLTLLATATAALRAQESSSAQAMVHEESQIYDNAQANSGSSATSEVNVPGGNFEERVQREYIQLKKQILVERAKMLRKESKKQWLRALRDGALVAGSTTGLGLGLSVTPILFPILGYIFSGLMFAVAGYTLINMIRHWDEMLGMHRTRGVLVTLLNIGMGLLALLNPPAWGFAALVGVGIQGLISGIINIAGAASNGSKADAATMEADFK